MLEKIGIMRDVQQKLSQLQAIPFIGPLAISPVKAVVSLAEAVAGIAFAIFFNIPALLFLHSRSMELASDSAAHVEMGITSLVYSVLNMATLGCVGFRANQYISI